MTYVYASKVLYTGKCVSMIRALMGGGAIGLFSFCLLSALCSCNSFFLFSDFLIF